jgi:diguanylate cyclase (GGDEF)-like protein
VINELNSIFNYPNLAENFLVILRSWYEESRYNDIFKKLRLVLVHSTEAYINLNTNQSPLNIGLTVKLPEFTIEEIHELAERYQLNWNVVGKNNVLALKTMVGGHPYLVQLALYNLVKSPQTTLQELLKEAPTINGIYSAHLRRLLMVLHDYPELGIALKKVIATNSFLELDQILAYKLESMGLVKLNGNKCTVSCELYRQFFAPQTFDEFSFHNQIQILRDQNIRLNYLCNIDDLTQLYNKRYFYAYLENCWKKSAFEKTPLSLILLDIDSLKIYNLTCGREAGDECVQQIANVIPSCVSQRDALVARYQDDTFAVILPNITADVAFEIAENIREEVKKLAIKHAIAKLGGLKLPVVTVSLGVACTIPTIEKFVGVFVGAALKALDESKKCEGDCTCVSNTFKYGFF